jgi:hypothetical protein
MPINVLMVTTLRITGAIDRQQPDPRAPTDPLSQWIGMVTVGWTEGGIPAERSAAILKASTGRGTGDKMWGQHVLLLRWIGDLPPAEIAQAVYDIIRDGGPDYRALSGAWDAQPLSETQASYRQVRA